MEKSDKVRIRLILDEGSVRCPVCQIGLRAGWGHKCEREGGITNSSSFKVEGK